MDGGSDDQTMTSSDDAEEEEAADAAIGSDDWEEEEEDETEEDKKEDRGLSASGGDGRAAGSGSARSGTDGAEDVMMVDGEQTQKNAPAVSDDDVQFVSEGRAKAVSAEENTKTPRDPSGTWKVNEIGLPLHGFFTAHFGKPWINCLPTGERALILDEEKPKRGAPPMKNAAGTSTYKVALFTLERQLWCTASQAGGILKKIGREAFDDAKRLLPVLTSVEEMQKHFPAVLTERRRKRNPKVTKGGTVKEESLLGFFITLPPLFGIGDLFIACGNDQSVAYDIACLNIVASLFFSGFMNDKREVLIDYISGYSTSQDPVPYRAPPGIKTVGRKVKRADLVALKQARLHGQTPDPAQAQAQAGPSRLPVVNGGPTQAGLEPAQPFPAEVIQQLNNQGRRPSFSAAAVQDMIAQVQGAKPQPQAGPSRLQTSNVAQRHNGAPVQPSDAEEEKLTRTKRRKLTTDVLTTEYVGKAPQFWETCLPTVPGTFSTLR